MSERTPNQFPRPDPERDNAHDLMPDWLRLQFPPLYATENTLDPVAVTKYFTPDSNWTWYPTEFDGEDIFFGYVEGFEKELGYFSLSELQAARGPLGLPIERDLYFDSALLSTIRSSSEP